MNSQFTFSAESFFIYFLVVDVTVVVAVAVFVAVVDVVAASFVAKATKLQFILVRCSPLHSEHLEGLTD